MAESTVHITGMTCGHCVETVTKALKDLSGVNTASVSLEEKNARVSYDEEKISLPVLTKAVTDAGFEISGT
ncbi:MAG: cation transporter [Nitrospira sp.]|nr:copper chaperone [Candidatus Manganitrophaceae bacterium]HIL34964.1 copper chaperone [Candidatus Manganitrophaceae bacterium]